MCCVWEGKEVGETGESLDVFLSFYTWLTRRLPLTTSGPESPNEQYSGEGKHPVTSYMTKPLVSSIHGSVNCQIHHIRVEADLAQ